MTSFTTASSSPVSSNQGGTAPSWNSQTRIVYSSNGNPREIPANEYDNYISNGWGSTPPTQSNQNDQGNPPPVIETPVVDTGDPALNALLASQQQMLEQLISNGQAINPNIEITPEQTAAWLEQAQGEIDPYYDTQMRLAREGLLRQAGYTSDEINAREADLESKYGRNVRKIASDSADTGMALSGRRIEGEGDLASETQNDINNYRRTAEYNMGNAARTFAGAWGSEDLPELNYGEAPTITAGSQSFNWSGGNRPFYNISDSVYDGLVGSQDRQRDTDVRERGSELEGAWRTKEENRIRTLTL